MNVNMECEHDEHTCKLKFLAIAWLVGLILEIYKN